MALNPATDYGIYRVDDVLQDLKDIYLGKLSDEGLRIGQATDELIRFHPGLYVTTGYSSMGKSEIWDWWMFCTAWLHGWRWAICSPENFPVATHVAKLLEKYTGGIFRDPKLTRLGSQPEDVKNAKEFIDEHFTWIYPPEDKLTIDYVLEAVAYIHDERPINGFLIDPYNQFDHARPSGQTETQYISHTLSKIHRFQKKRKLLACIVAHPAKVDRKERSSGRPVPTLEDISGSSTFWTKCDVGVVWHRDDVTKNTGTVYIQKTRWKQKGKIGQVNMDYDIVSGRFKDVHAPIYDVPHRPGEEPAYE